MKFKLYGLIPLEEKYFLISEGKILKTINSHFSDPLPLETSSGGFVSTSSIIESAKIETVLRKYDFPFRIADVGDIKDPHLKIILKKNRIKFIPNSLVVYPFREKILGDRGKNIKLENLDLNRINEEPAWIKNLWFNNPIAQSPINLSGIIPSDNKPSFEISYWGNFALKNKGKRINGFSSSGPVFDENGPLKFDVYMEISGFASIRVGGEVVEVTSQSVGTNYSEYTPILVSK